MRWTRAQREILAEHSCEGAEKCARIIYRQTGVKRSVEAVRRQIYREGLSIAKPAQTCPMCGAIVPKLSASGFCVPCTKYENAERARKAREEIESAEYRERMARAQREWDRERKRLQRAREHGLNKF